MAGRQQWAFSNEMPELVPTLEKVTGVLSVGNWLSRQALDGKIKRRLVPESRQKRWAGKGRVPMYEYNVTSVRERTEDLLSKRSTAR